MLLEESGICGEHIRDIQRGVQVCNLKGRGRPEDEEHSFLSSLFISIHPGQVLVCEQAFFSSAFS